MTKNKGIKAVGDNSFLEDLNDVDLSTPPVAGQSIVYDGTKWIPGTSFGAGVSFVVGNAADVTAGRATHTLISAAQTAASDGDKIILLNRTITENITMTKRIFLEGVGNDSVIDGTVTFSAGAEKSMFKFLKFNENITVDNGVVDLIITDCWIANTKTVTDNNPDLNDKENLYLLKSEE